MQNPLPEFRIADDKASQSCSPSNQAKRARQKVKTRIRNVNALRLLKSWRGLTIATAHHVQISNLIQKHKGRKNHGEAMAACTITLDGKSLTF